ncbi:hypothetical protein BOW86_gp201 [Synechococcus phage S-CAM7]|uniref:Uncharacterized protein n=1 Tax=Synechococcus phage S-CAM7 TaxID=1883368 RepID=A0A1D8KU31_9CAUD|nr:hypothetical protein BOW86_gp201 [Synechococcus phage S-CAM7]AOV62180.1 hypothetical protein C490910_258 [Synechococcus phage S-CAM7]QLF86312.1 hypothetical protein CC030809_00264 [Synechococcus phage S-CAM7]
MAEATTKKTRTRKPSASKVTTTAKKKAPVSLELPRNPLMFEILDLVSKQRTKAKKVEALKKHECLTLKSLFIWNFDETVVSQLPEGDVPYGDPEDQLKYNGTLSENLADKSRQMYTDGNFSLGSADTNGRTTLRAQTRNFYHFVQGGNPGLSGMRRESMFINLLQSVHPLEAEIMVLVKDGLLSDSYAITQEVVAEAYPDIVWGGRG